jgi:hypothetical protein
MLREHQPDAGRAGRRSAGLRGVLARSGGGPTPGLYFDSEVTTCSESSRLNERGRGSAAWTKAVIDTPRRFHQDIRHAEELARLRGYAGTLRQVAIDGLGNERPTLLFSNETAETARNVKILADRVEIRPDRRGHNPVLREAALDRDSPPMPWLGTGRSSSLSPDRQVRGKFPSWKSALKVDPFLVASFDHEGISPQRARTHSRLAVGRPPHNRHGLRRGDVVACRRPGAPELPNHSARASGELGTR